MDKVISTDTLPPCVLRNGVEGRKYSPPDAHTTNRMSNVESLLQGPTGRASELTVLGGLLCDIAITMSLGSQVGDGPVETYDRGCDEADHPGAGNGWARLSDSLPVRSVGDLPWPIVADRRCTYSICFCEEMEDCRPSIHGPDNTTHTHTKESLAREWDRKHPRAELDVGGSERNPYIGLKRAKASEIRKLLTEIGWQAQRSRELFMRAQELQNRLKAHRAFGEEVDNDYDSDDNEDQ